MRDLDPIFLDERIKKLEENGGGGGTSNYNQLTNKPSIEGITLQGNKTFEDLGIASSEDLAQTDEDLQELSDKFVKYNVGKLTSGTTDTFNVPYKSSEYALIGFLMKTPTQTDFFSYGLYNNYISLIRLEDNLLRIAHDTAIANADISIILYKYN